MHSTKHCEVFFGLFVSYLLQLLLNPNDPMEDGFILSDFFFFDLKTNTTSPNIYIIYIYIFFFFLLNINLTNLLLDYISLFNILTKVCDAISYEVTFLPLKAFINYINLKFLGLFILVFPLKLWQPLLLTYYSQLFVSLAVK